MRVETVQMELASQGRRLGAYLLDYAVLQWLTLYIGWIIWYLIVATQGQSPAKQLLGMRVVREDGVTAGLGWMLLRDLVVRGIVFGNVIVWGALLGSLLGGPGILLALLAAALAILAPLWCVWDKDRQCLWDKVVSTYVVRTDARYVTPAAGAPVRAGAAAPTERIAENLRTLAELHERGLLTDEEYEERRAREAGRL